jgi:alpha-beta hydrolase superfamily lysophospholipase
MDMSTNFVNAKGLRLATYILYSNRPKGTLIYFHGFGGHAMSDLQTTKEVLLENGVNIATFDYAGHGNSSGDRFAIKSYEDLINDARMFMDIIQEDDYLCQYPLFIMGTSTGGAIASKILEEYPNACHGILVSPLYGIAETFFYLIMSKVVAVAALVGPDIKISQINKNPNEEYRKIWEADPLTLKSSVTVGTANELIKLSKTALNGISNLQTDITCLQSVKDTQVNAERNIRLFTAHPRRSIIQFKESWHMLLLEEEQNKARTTILDIIYNSL